MNAQDLARWTRFADKGGIGKCTALIDCVAEEMSEDLMFLKVRVYSSFLGRRFLLVAVTVPTVLSPLTPVKYTGGRIDW